MTEPRVCIVDQRTELEPTEAQTCVKCLGASRRSLMDVQEMYALLPAELQGRAGAASPMEPNGHIHADGDPLPGGDVMVMLGPGSTRAHVRMPEGRVDKGDPDAVDPAAADSVLGMLERWETDWRITFGDGQAITVATVTDCAGYLLRRLDHAARRHPAFDEFASDLGVLRAAMEHALRRHQQRSPVPCITCGARALERPEPREDGRAFEWQCGRCHRNYTQDEYWIAARQQGEAV